MFISPYTKSVQCQRKQQVIYCPLLVKWWLSQKLGGEVWLTCSHEHNLILAIICQNSVHHNVSQGVVNFDTCEHRTTSERVDRVIHQRVESNKSDNFIREVFSGLDLWIICFAWALKLQKKSQLISDRVFYISFHQFNYGADSLKQFIGMCLLLEAKIRTAGDKAYVKHLFHTWCQHQIVHHITSLN